MHGRRTQFNHTCFQSETLESRRLLSSTLTADSGIEWSRNLSGEYTLVSAGDDGSFAIADGRWSTYQVKEQKRSVISFGPDGEVAWTSHSTFARIHDIAVGPAGDVWVAGWIGDRSAGYEGVLQRYSPAGERVWQFTWADEISSAVLAVDAQGNAFVGGTATTNIPGEALQSVQFVSRIDADGELAWNQTLQGSPDSGSISALSHDGNGGVVVAGYATHRDNFVAHIDNTGELRWSTMIPRVADDRPYAVGISDDGSVKAFGVRFPHVDSRSLWIAELDADGTLTQQPAFPLPQSHAVFGGVIERGEIVFYGGYIRTLPDPFAEADYEHGFVGRVVTGQLAIAYPAGDGYGYLNGMALTHDGQILATLTTKLSEMPNLRNTPRAMNGVYEYLLSIDPDRLHLVQPSFTIYGSEGPDLIWVHPAKVQLNGQTVAGVRFVVNGVEATIVPSAALEIRGIGGDDMIVVDQGVRFPVIVYGGAGNDTITGGSGDDLLYGGDGHDVISGGAGNDTLYGNFGSDTLSGGTGDDQIFAGIGRDVINGGEGDDTLLGGNGMDLIRGGAGHDSIDGKGKADTIYGGSGNDTLIGGAGDNQINGGEGDDLIDAAGDGPFRDILNGGAGHDRYTADEDDILIDLEEALLV